MDSQLPLLQQKIKEEDNNINQKTNELIESWEVDKPNKGLSSDGSIFMHTPNCL